MPGTHMHLDDEALASLDDARADLQDLMDDWLARGDDITALFAAMTEVLDAHVREAGHTLQ